MEQTGTTENKKTILIIDDQPRNLQLAAYVLNQQYQLVLVNSGQKGLRLAEEKKPDLILLDIMMPEMSGIEVCRRLKSNEVTKNIPVIIVTAKTEEADIVEAYEVGAVDYVVKPFRANELLARVRTHITISDQQHKLKQLNKDLMRLNQNKDQLFSVISHDLRGYASRIVSLTALLKLESGELPSSVNQMLELLKISADKNSELLDDLLMWVRNQFNEVDVKFIPTLLNELLIEAKDQVMIHAVIKGVTFNNQVSSDLIVNVNRDMMITVFRNLFSNAIKFSKDGGEICIDAERTDQQVIIKVCDKGVGIKKEDVDKLFKDKETILSKAGTDGERGTGFGLALCQDFIEKHKGTISVDSEPDKGSTFIISLPV